MKTALKYPLMILSLSMLANLSNLTASTYTYSQSVDLRTIQIYPYGGLTNYYYTQIFLPNPNITLSSGDTIQGSIIFTNGLQLSISDLSNTNGYVVTSFISFYPSSNSSSLTSLYTFNFRELNGQNTVPNGISGGVSGGSIAAIASDFTTNVVSFSGFDYSINLTSGGPVTLDNCYLNFQAPYVNVSAVPEPSTYALFGLGALVLVMAARRKIAR